MFGFFWLSMKLNYCYYLCYFILKKKNIFWTLNLFICFIIYNQHFWKAQAKLMIKLLKHAPWNALPLTKIFSAKFIRFSFVEHQKGHFQVSNLFNLNFAIWESLKCCLVQGHALQPVPSNIIHTLFLRLQCMFLSLKKFIQYIWWHIGPRANFTTDERLLHSFLECEFSEGSWEDRYILSQPLVC